MPYATLIAPVEADPEPDSRLALAVDLANQFDAKLIGIGAEQWRVPAVSADYSAGIIVAAEMGLPDTSNDGAARPFCATAHAAAA